MELKFETVEMGRGLADYRRFCIRDRRRVNCAFGGAPGRSGRPVLRPQTVTMAEYNSLPGCPAEQNSRRKL